MIGLGEEDREMQKKERIGRWKRIGRSEYSRWYKEVKGEGILRYLKKGWGESRWRKVQIMWRVKGDVGTYLGGM